jgi:hypothetical protein
MLFTCAGSNKRQSKSTAEAPMADTSDCVIDKSEFVTFWNRFSAALLADDTDTLSGLIDDSFYFSSYCPMFKHNKICRIDFSTNSTFSKQRFLKEFKQSLNPVYLQLIRQYEINKHTKIKPAKTVEDMQNRYLCETIIEKDTYYVYAYFENKEVDINIGYKYNEVFDNNVGMSLIFHKKNNKIQLCEIDFYYYFIQAD